MEHTHWTMENQPALPWHTILPVYLLVVEEFVSNLSQRFLHLRIENHIFPFCLLHFIPQLRTAHPRSIIHIDGRLLLDKPGTYGRKQAVDDGRVGHGCFLSNWLFQNVLNGCHSEQHSVQDEGFTVPGVPVPGKEDAVDKISRAALHAVNCGPRGPLAGEEEWHTR